VSGTCGKYTSTRVVNLHLVLLECVAVQRDVEWIEGMGNLCIYWLHRGTEISHQGCLVMFGSDRVLITRGVSDAQRHQEEARGFSLALAKQRVELERAQDEASRWRSEAMSLQTRVACAEERVHACGELFARYPILLQYTQNSVRCIARVGRGGEGG
jgi:hypothetical protein